MLIDDERNKQLDIALSKKYTKRVSIVTRDQINKILVDTREHKQSTSPNKKPRGVRDVARTSIGYSLSQSKSLKVQKERGWFGDSARHAEAARGAKGLAYVKQTALLSLGIGVAIQLAKPVIAVVSAGIRSIKAGVRVAQRGVRIAERGVRVAERVGRAGQRVARIATGRSMQWALGIAAAGVLLSKLRQANSKRRRTEPPKKFIKQISTPEEDGRYVASVLEELAILSDKEKKEFQESLNDKEQDELTNILTVLESVQKESKQETKKDAAASAVNPREKGKDKEVKKEYSGQNLTNYPNVHSNPPDRLPGNQASTEKIRLGQIVQELTELIRNLEELQSRGQIQGIITERDTDELVTPILEEAQRLLSSIDPSRKASDSEQQLLRVDKGAVGRAVGGKIEQVGRSLEESGIRSAARNFSETRHYPAGRYPAGKTRINVGGKIRQVGASLQGKRKLKPGQRDRQLANVGIKEYRRVTPVSEQIRHQRQLRRKVTKVIRREGSGYALHFSDGRKEKFATRGAAENRERQIQYFKHRKSFDIIYDKLDKLTVEKGWIGDAVRHAEAARRGWEGRGGKKKDITPKDPEKPTLQEQAQSKVTRQQQKQSQRRESRINRLLDMSVNAEVNRSVHRAENKLTNIGKGIIKGTAGNTAKVVNSTVGIFGDLGSDAAIGVIGSAFTLAALGIKPNEILGVGLFSASRVIRGITKLPKLRFLRPVERPISIALFKMGRKLKGVKTIRGLRRR